MTRTPGQSKRRGGFGWARPVAGAGQIAAADKQGVVAALAIWLGARQAGKHHGTEKAESERRRQLPALGAQYVVPAAAAATAAQEGSRVRWTGPSWGEALQLARLAKDIRESDGASGLGIGDAAAAAAAAAACARGGCV